MSNEKILDGRIVVVTGASRGIGYHSAIAIAKAGAHVVAIARTVGGLEELDDEIRAIGGTATLVPLDLKDFEAIDRLGASLNERYGRVDGLLGNAGVLATPTPLHQMSPKAFEDVLAINVTANFRLIRSLDPLLRVSPSGRALFVTSGATESLRPYMGSYSCSKAALEAMVITYAKENRQGPMRINLIDPGTLRTKMRAQYAPGEDPNTVTPPEAIGPTMVKLLSPECTETGKIYSFTKDSWK